MGLLKALPNEASYLKAGFQGFQGSGKTYTATLLACAAYRHFNLSGPIAFFDTETGSDYIAGTVKELTGQDLVRVKSQRFDDLMEVTREVEAAGIQMLLVDSMTHVWRELCDSHLNAVNEVAARKGWRTRANLEFQDWNPIKTRFNDWTRWYLSSRVHTLICGRAGYNYDHEKDERGKKELVKTGVKMKTEGEFGFEPSLLVHMEQEQDITGDSVRMSNSATVLKDRFDEIQGRREILAITGERESLEDKLGRTWGFFAPHVKRLNPGSYTPIQTETGSAAHVDELGNDPRRVERDITLEKIENALTSAFPSTSGRDKKCKIAALSKCFGTSSWTEITTRRTTTQLVDGLALLEPLMKRCVEAANEGIPLEELLGESVRV